MHPPFDAGRAALRASPPSGAPAGLAPAAAPRGCSLPGGSWALCTGAAGQGDIEGKVAQPAPGVLSICFSRF